MKNRLNPALVGMFVLGAALLLLLAFVSFGGSGLFSKPTRFLVYFEESVSGLDPGAAVKVSGVRIGRVAAINVLYDSAARAARVQTICEIDRNVLVDRDGNTIELTNPVELQNLIDRGLRAKLNLQGITGLMFVELSFEDPRAYPARPSVGAEQYPVVPSIRSPISQVQNSILEIVADLKAANLAALSADVRTLVGTANRKLTELDAAGLAQRLGAAAAAIEQFMAAPAARDAFVNLNAAVADLRGLLQRVEAQVGPVGDELRRTLSETQAAMRSVDSAASTTRRFVQAQDGLGEEATRALQEIGAAAEALQRLAEALERNPNAVLLGRPPAGDERP